MTENAKATPPAFLFLALVAPFLLPTSSVLPISLSPFSVGTEIVLRQATNLVFVTPPPTFGSNSVTMLAILTPQQHY